MGQVLRGELFAHNFDEVRVVRFGFRDALVSFGRLRQAAKRRGVDETLGQIFSLQPVALVEGAEGLVVESSPIKNLAKREEQLNPFRNWRRSRMRKRLDLRDIAICQRGHIHRRQSHIPARGIRPTVDQAPQQHLRFVQLAGKARHRGDARDRDRIVWRCVRLCTVERQSSLHVSQFFNDARKRQTRVL